jgi:hypothetical protein
MNYSNFSVFNNNEEKTKERTIINLENRRGNENIGLNREVLFNKETNKNFLNDRDMFFRISNNTEDIDTTDNKFCDYSGMPIKNMQILNNKKNLINNPYIYEKKNEGSKISCMNEFNSTNQEFSIINENYEELEAEIMNLNDSIDLMEKDIVNQEYTSNINNKKIFNVFSPFSLAYLWKSIILLSKNPTTDKLLTMLGFKKKEVLLNDMKNHSELIKNIILVNCQLPATDNIINTTFINKIEEIYNIKVSQNNDNQNTENQNNEKDNKFKFELHFNYTLQIPELYKPEIISGKLKDNINKIKFIKLINVPVSIQIINDNVLIEADFIYNKIGFTFKKDENNIDKIDYDILLKDKDYNTIAKMIIFPKLNKKIRNNYGKKFTLDKLHLGEVLYGKMYNMDIISNLNLEIAVNNLVDNIDYNTKKNIRYIDEIILNHKLFFYIKDKTINNRIICSGLINY